MLDWAKNTLQFKKGFSIKMTHSSKNYLQFDMNRISKDSRSKVWKDTMNSFYYEYDFCFSNDFMRGEFIGSQIGDLKIASTISDAQSSTRTSSHVRRDGFDAYFLLFPCNKNILFKQRGEDSLIESNMITLGSTSSPSKYSQGSETQIGSIIVPGKFLRQFVNRADDILATAFHSSEVVRMLHHLGSSLCKNFQNIDEYSQKMISRQCVEMFGLLVDGVDPRSSATVIQQAHYRRITHFIEQNFADHDLSIKIISSKLRLSIRYIQLITANHNTNILSMIRHRRIKEAKRMLLNRKLTRQSIGYIAFFVGFNDVCHFNRVFKENTGLSPSDFSG